jgi:hypothetical protein
MIPMRSRGHFMEGWRFRGHFVESPVDLWKALAKAGDRSIHSQTGFACI